MFSIIIVNWNGEKLLTPCLESIKKSTFKDFKLYIVDNGSKDNSIEVLKKYQNELDIDIIPLDKNYGFAPANNIGIDKAINDGSQYIITLNNDIEVKENTFEVLRNYINENKDVDVFQLMMINYYERNKIDAAGLGFDKAYFAFQVGFGEDISNIPSLSVELDGACAGAAVYSKKALIKVKEGEKDYFSGDFFAYYEDADLALRLKKLGFKTNLVKDAVVYHMHSATGNKNSTFKDYYLTRNLLKYFKRNTSVKEYRILKLKAYKSRGTLAGKYMLKGNFKGVSAIVKGIVDFEINK